MLEIQEFDGQSNGMNPKVTVIISTYSIERFAYICECIASLKKQTIPPFEILLVLDPDPRLIGFYKSHEQQGVTIVESNRRGLSAARNIGIKQAKGEFIAFIDDDAVAKADWLELLLKSCNLPDVLGVGGLVKPVWECGRPLWFPEEVDWIVGCSYPALGEKRRNIRNPIGCSMLFRRSVFDKAGLFDDDIGRYGKHLLGSEEVEFSIRVLDTFQGSKILYDPSAVVYHWVPNKRCNTKYFMKRSYYEGVSKRLVKQLASNSASNIFSSEQSYLQYLMKTSIVKRVKPKKSNYLQLIMLLNSTLLVSAGYLTSYILTHRK